MIKEDLARAIYNKAYLTGEFLLRSGKISNEYFDKYQFEANPVILKEIAFQISEMIDLEFDLIAALEMGGIPIATMISQITGKSMVFVRKSAKEYGTRKFAEGPEIKNKKLLIVEDVVTSGGQIITSANELRNAGAIVNKAVCVIDRESGGTENLLAEGIHLDSLFKMSELKRWGNL
jgi:orotate phosphoribosyltransferase